MLKVGETQTLIIEKQVPFGVYLAEYIWPKREERKESCCPDCRCRRAPRWETGSRSSSIEILRTV